MKRRLFVTVVALVVAFVVGGTVAYAQTASAEIGFAFVAAGKEMAAGRYTIEVTHPLGPVRLTGPKGSTDWMPVVTTLGRHDLDKGPEFVFDKIEGKLLLSEVWIPGQDGFLLLASKGPHGHAVVGGSNPRK
jgi:hypothetical protein